MKKVRRIILFCALGSIAFFIQAQNVNAEQSSAKPHKAHADRNKDGQVDKKEQKLEQRQKAKVDTRWEKKADVDKDGIVEPKEAAAAKKYLREKSVVDRPWEEAADANKDGKVDWQEIRVYHKTQMDSDHNGIVSVEERRAYWVKTKSVVNTEYEKKYDTDGDGYLSWTEGKEMLKDKYEIIQTKGKAIVNTDLETEFDTNNDGVIDRSEAPAVREAIKD